VLSSLGLGVKVPHCTPSSCYATAPAVKNLGYNGTTAIGNKGPEFFGLKELHKIEQPCNKIGFKQLSGLRQYSLKIA